MADFSRWRDLATLRGATELFRELKPSGSYAEEKAIAGSRSCPQRILEKLGGRVVIQELHDRFVFGRVRRPARSVLEVVHKKLRLVAHFSAPIPISNAVACRPEEYAVGCWIPPPSETRM